MIKTFVVRRNGVKIDEFISTCENEEQALEHWWRGLCPKALRHDTGNFAVEVRCD